MNYSKPELINSIRELERAGLKPVQIARQLGLKMETVTRHKEGPKRASYGRQSKEKAEVIDTRPGFCACGCGEQTRRIPYGENRGTFMQWKQGHSSAALRKQRLARDPNYKGAIHWQRASQVEEIRAKMVAAFHANRFATRNELLESFSKEYKEYEHRTCALSKILCNGLRDESRKLNEDRLPVPKFIKKIYYTLSLPPYERKHIPYESETDIAYYTRSGRFVCLDDSATDDGRDFHEIISGYELTPLEALMEKEDEELQREMDLRDDLRTRRKEFTRWQELRNGLLPLAQVFEGIAI